MKTMLIAAAAAALLAAPAGAQPAMPVPGAADVSRVQAGTYQADPEHTLVEFSVNHMGFSPYFGLFGGATGSLTLDPAHLDRAQVRITIPLDRLTVANAHLSEHLKSDAFFDAAKYPTATFTSTRVAAHGTTATITGELTVKGRTAPVTLQARFVGAGADPMKKGAATVGFEATGVVSRSALGVSAFVPAVSDEVRLKIAAAFVKAG
ncbi:MAG: YceI family protein [Caulobacteraceae bacterium]|nr:YceI family protein [Caulobacter sp.]